jgi:uncharacterized membrane protein
MISKRSQILGWVEDGSIAPENVRQALDISGVSPDRIQWFYFLDRMLLALGALGLACAVVFFFAFNWNDLGRFTQFGLVQLLLLIAIVLYWRLGAVTLSAKISLLVASLLLGTLLALFGQTYQTGADPWQLFATWAVLMLPWTLIGRFAALWLLFLALLNLSIYQYYESMFGLLGIAFATQDDLVWMLLALNTGAWVVWERASRHFDWLAGFENSRWAVRLIASASGFAVTVLVLRAIFDSDSSLVMTWLVYVTWLETMSGTFLLLALLVMAQAAAAAIWLRKVNTEQQA